MLVPFRNKIPDNGGKLPIWEASKTFSLPAVSHDQKGGRNVSRRQNTFSISLAQQNLKRITKVCYYWHV